MIDLRGYIFIRIMVIDIKTGKKLSVSKQVHSLNIVSFTKEIKEALSRGYNIKVINTSLKFTRFGKKQSFFAELIKENIAGGIEK